MKDWNVGRFSWILVLVTGLFLLFFSFADFLTSAGLVLSGSAVVLYLFVFVYRLFLINRKEEVKYSITPKLISSDSKPQLTLSLNFKLKFLWVAYLTYTQNDNYEGLQSTPAVLEKDQIRAKLKPLRRGKWKIKVENLILYDPFGFFKVRIPLNYSEFIFIPPREIKVNQLPSIIIKQKPSFRGENKKLMILPNASYDKIREYVPGDPSKRINWKLSAKKGVLQVRVPERRIIQEIVVRIILDNQTIFADKRNYKLTRLDYNVLDHQIKILQVLIKILQRSNAKKINLSIFDTEGWETKTILPQDSYRSYAPALAESRPVAIDTSLKEHIRDEMENSDFVYLITPQNEFFDKDLAHLFVNVLDFVAIDKQESKKITGGSFMAKSYIDRAKNRVSINKIKEFYELEQNPNLAEFDGSEDQSQIINKIMYSKNSYDPNSKS